MKFTTLAFFLAFIMAVHTFNLKESSDHMESLEEQLEENQDKQDQLYAKMFQDIHELQKYAKKVRARRGSCGFKLLEKIAEVCGDISSGSEVDLATICCSKQCPDSFIQASACPDKKA
ncbi:hypothetical protein L5515_015534 [Caenorhabditis briggsae]|uniref:INSulin related n=1 Tax=Caenorhabditis briggsae TaxID=6238 RepID=A0AAE9EEY7_CAEBR|nr:hypothetical protein L5515_015534 [Caenorhabditis briggsae]